MYGGGRREGRRVREEGERNGKGRGMECDKDLLMGV